MLSVFICEDVISQKKQLEKYIKDYIMMEELDMELVLSTDNPYDILAYLKANPNTIGLYFLDVDLKSDITGIGLASEIRELDVLGNIVFVTTHGELTYLTFVYKVEAMDYIIKDTPEKICKRIQECLDIANKRHLNDQNSEKKLFKIKTGSSVRYIDHSEIMFFESGLAPHKVVLHLRNSQIEFYHTINELANIGDEFYRCHKSFVVNKNNIQNINKAEKIIEMVNGETCLISSRAMKGLLE
ncbi:MAG: response regulator transcription factor [Clostridiales bacterium]|mgnify:FL=1|nr:response regulator transcription factor [Clostridiales bacterium]